MTRVQFELGMASVFSLAEHNLFECHIYPRVLSEN